MLINRLIPVRMGVVAFLALVSACGGGGSGSGSNAESQRGQLLGSSTETVKADEGAAAIAAVNSPPAQGALTNLSLLLKTALPTLNGSAVASPPGVAFPCGFKVHKIRYKTVGAAGESASASAAVYLPTGEGPVCKADKLPVVMAAHGTTTNKAYDLSAPANFSAPSESMLYALLFAAQGYVVVAPNYAGYADSDLGYHPYLIMEQQAKDMQDALTAAKASGLFKSNDKLYITGYSQGGAVAVATQRALEAAGTKPVAVAGLSGPLAMLSFGDRVLSGTVNRGANIFTPMLVTAAQKAYGNIYNQPGDIYAPTFSGFLPNLLPGMNLEGSPNFGSLIAANMLPDAVSEFGKGANAILTPAMRNAYLADISSAQVTNPLRAALQKNDLRSGWNPAAPLLLCGASNDGTVFFENSTVAFIQYVENKRAQLGGTHKPLVKLDLYTQPTPADNFSSLRAAFAAAGLSAQNFDLVRTAVGPNTLDVHSSASPFCYAAALGFFTSINNTP